MLKKIVEIFKNKLLQEKKVVKESKDKNIFISPGITITNHKTGEVTKLNKPIESNGTVEFTSKGIFINGNKIED